MSLCLSSVSLLPPSPFPENFLSPHARDRTVAAWPKTHLWPQRWPVAQMSPSEAFPQVFKVERKEGGQRLRNPVSGNPVSPPRDTMAGSSSVYQTATR